MKQNTERQNIVGWIFGLILFTIGILNIILVHAVPGVLYLIFSLLFLPPSQNSIELLIKRVIPLSIQLIVFVLIMWFTLGVSDLGEIMVL